MHLMEAFTALCECTGNAPHRKALHEDVDVLTGRIVHPQFATGNPQFRVDWRVAAPAKSDIVWGLGPVCRRRRKGPRRRQYVLRPQGGVRLAAAARAERARRAFRPVRADHADTTRVRRQGRHRLRVPRRVRRGPARRLGGYDTEKEFWQQAETLTGMLDGCLFFGMDPYWQAYEAVHRLAPDTLVNCEVGEWWPLLTRDGSTPIWTHMSHSWKVNCHSVRSVIQSISRLESLLAA
jgi:mannobiose 2-epimerase